MKNSKSFGFTLIELLIVIAILGTLAVVVLLALNPVQQLARTRDAGRISGVTQLGHAVEAYATNTGEYPRTFGTCTGGNWVGCLVDTAEINTAPSEIEDRLNKAPCSQNVVNNTWCYAVGTTAGGRLDAVVYAHLESQSNRQKCTTGEPYAVYSTADGRGGIVCGVPSVGPQTFAD